jgi:uncharacterized protein YbcV (DUF1398 family)
MHTILIPVVLAITLTQQPLTTTTMFTLEQIAQAHSRVKSGADFPRYVQDIIALGVQRYTTWLTDGHTDYEGQGQQLSTAPKYAAQPIADWTNDTHFRKRLQFHQQGGTDFPTFCAEARAAGVQRWVVDTEAMTCTYFTPSNEVVLVEAIPVP